LTLPQLHEGRDGQKQLIKLVNELRRNVPAPTHSVLPVGEFSLMSSGQIPCVPVTVVGWVTTFALIVPVEIVGVQSGGADIRIGTVASGYADIAPSMNLGTALVVGEVVTVTLTSPAVSVTDAAYLDVIGGTGPTTLTAMLYLGGYFR
jgi:hypothetical protein